MSVKKLLVLSAAGLASVAAVAAFAGGPDVAPAPVPAPSYQGFYVQGDVGYAYTPWQNLFGAGTFSENFFAVGGDIGYQWSRYLAVEFGGFWHNNTTFAGVTLSDWFLFSALKLMAPLPWIDGVDIYGKAGAAYRRISVSFGGFSANNWFVRPLFALGLQYNINDAWFAKVQWMYVDGVNRFAIPSTNQFTVGLGYKFSV